MWACGIIYVTLLDAGSHVECPENINTLQHYVIVFRFVFSPGVRSEIVDRMSVVV